jgi:hypothetical protein
MSAEGAWFRECRQRRQTYCTAQNLGDRRLGGAVIYQDQQALGPQIKVNAGK